MGDLDVEGAVAMMIMRSIPFWIFCAAIGLAQDPKPEAPGEEAQARAEKEIRDIFKEEYALKTITAQRKLATLLLRQGRETKDDASLKYVMFREAADLAGRSGDIDTLLGSLDAISTSFRIDSLLLSGPFLLKADPAITAPEDLRKLAEALLRLAREALAQDQFDGALKMAQAALGPAKKSKDLGLVVRADGVAKSVQEAKT
ncbi:MAG TPA: hypothetical protein VG457_09280, partial [Planctomycetota bacterium]|nr:hypothetical protein [Planctomycetota bacterium]